MNLLAKLAALLRGPPVPPPELARALDSPAVTVLTGPRVVALAVTASPAHMGPESARRLARELWFAADRAELVEGLRHTIRIAE